ncbi:hypothetical protein QQF64_034589 [Cirrhinus molitorella]|uniref:DUF6729 domain-containing protein n=1 Tax=Cirrhinus molitorella TaxID=172907 RepID=A0ABR3L0Z6_9TELE
MHSLNALLQNLKDVQRVLCRSVSISQNHKNTRSSTELPVHWKDYLPPFQHEWIRNTLFKANPRTGKPQLVSQLKLWWYPPQPPLIHTQPPASPDLFFCLPFFLWMPLKMWLFPLVCVRPDCGKHRLTAAGLYRTVRKVLDIDGWYDLATEYLECKCCKKQQNSWIWATAVSFQLC